MSLLEHQNNYRKYLGRHEIFIMGTYGKKVLIVHLEEGYVGNKKCGYKDVKPGDMDIVLIRHCRRIRDI